MKPQALKERPPTAVAALAGQNAGMPSPTQLEDAVVEAAILHGFIQCRAQPCIPPGHVVFLDPRLMMILEEHGLETALQCATARPETITIVPIQQVPIDPREGSMA